MKALGKMKGMFKAAQPFLLTALLGAALAGCAGRTAGPSNPVFFPPPPLEPHVQYLMGINDSTDIEGKPSGFSLVLTGSEQGNVIKMIGKPYGIAAKNGKLYVASSNGSQVIIIDFEKKKFDFLKGNVKGPGALKRPVNVAVDDDGTMYVADAGRDEIVVYDAAGNFLRAVGKVDPAEGKKSNIVSVAVSGNLLYVLDNRGNEIRVLEKTTGEVIKTFGNDADSKKSVALPSNMGVDADGFIYVSNIGKANVMKFDHDGNFLFDFGKVSDLAGGFTRPKGVAVDKDGWIYVVDAAFSNVQVFDKDARHLLGYFGSPGLPAGSLNLPAGIAVTSDNLSYFQALAAPDFILDKVVFVTNQSTSVINPTISVYGMGEMKGSKKQSADQKDASPARK